MVASAPSVARFADALLRGELLSPDSRRQLLQFVPASEGYDGYGLGVGQGQTGTEKVWGHFGAGPGFVTVVSHVPAKEITVAALSSGDVDFACSRRCSLKRRLRPTRPQGHGPGRDAPARALIRPSSPARAVAVARVPRRSPVLAPTLATRLRQSWTRCRACSLVRA